MIRVFTPEDQRRFAHLSGDFNPLHVDPIAARRMLFGRTVVHGIHAVLWSLDRYLAEAPASEPVRITNIKVQFQRPIMVGEPITQSVRKTADGQMRLELSSMGARLTTILVRFETGARLGDGGTISPGVPVRQECLRPTVDDLRIAAGIIPLHLDRGIAETLFPVALNKLPPEQIATLLATTRLVGMEAPGLHSIYTGLELAAGPMPANPGLNYKTEDYDERFSMLTIGVAGPGLTGQINAALRPEPKTQSSFAQLQSLVQKDEFRETRALVIGGSRGLGEVAVKELAAGGAEVRFTYRHGNIEATQVAADVTAGGGTVSCFGYDVQSDSQILTDLLDKWKPTLLCYFATPPVTTVIPGRFSPGRFHALCDCYIDGFANTFHAVKGEGTDMTGVVYPSSSAIDDLPSNMGEYAIAKAAAERLCVLLAKTHRHIRFEFPRLPRLATDQTASLMQVDSGDANAIVLQMLRNALLQREHS